MIRMTQGCLIGLHVHYTYSCEVDSLYNCVCSLTLNLVPVIVSGTKRDYTCTTRVVVREFTGQLNV
jgi:hypothetical protein